MARSTKAPELASSEQIEETNHSSNSVANEKLALNLENDPHRAALEDNPDEAAKVTFRKTLVIFVRAPSSPYFLPPCPPLLLVSFCVFGPLSKQR